MLDFRPKGDKHGWRTNGKHLMNPSVCNKFRKRRKFLLSYEGKRIGMRKLARTIERGWDGPSRDYRHGGYDYESRQHFLRISEGKTYNEVVEDLKRRTKRLDKKYGLNACKRLYDRCLNNNPLYYWGRSSYYFDDNGILRYNGAGRQYKVRGMKRKDVAYNSEHFDFDLGNLNKGASKYYVGKLMVHIIPSGKRINEPVDVWMIDWMRYNNGRKGKPKDWIIQEKYQKVYVPGIGEHLYHQVINNFHQLRIQRFEYYRSTCFYFIIKK